MRVSIDHGIPMPERVADKHRNTKYPFRSMKVGDSVVCDGNVTHAANLCNYWRKALASETDFAWEAQDNGTVRIWRVR